MIIYWTKYDTQNNDYSIIIPLHGKFILSRWL